MHETEETIIGTLSLRRPQVEELALYSRQDSSLTEI